MILIDTNLWLYASPQESAQHAQAFELVEGWLWHPLVEVVQPGPSHWSVLGLLIQEAGTAGNLTSDAHLAALAIEHDCTLCSADNDFRRFPGLRFHNPLV